MTTISLGLRLRSMWHEPSFYDAELHEWAVLVLGLDARFNIGVPCFWPLKPLEA